MKADFSFYKAVSRKASLCFFISAILVFVLAGNSYSTELTIGIIPHNNVFDQVRRYRLLSEYIEKKTGLKIRYSILSKFGNIVENFERRNLDGAFWESFPGALAIRQLGMQPVACQVNTDNSSTHTGYIIVHRYSVINSAERMKGADIAFVDQASASGYLFPLAYLRESGITDLEGFFKRQVFAGNHADVIRAVLEGQVDIGSVKNTVFKRESALNPLVDENLVVLAKSPELPSTGLGIKKDIPFALREDLKSVLIGMKKDPEGRRVLDRIGAAEFIEMTENDYKNVFDLSDAAGIDIKDYHYISK